MSLIDVKPDLPGRKMWMRATFSNKLESKNEFENIVCLMIAKCENLISLKNG